MIQEFISLVFPQICMNCGRSLISQEHSLCTSCKIDLPFTNDYSNPQNELFQKFAFETKVQTVQSFLYFNKKGITQKLLHQLKYQGKKEIGITLGKWFAPQLKSLSLDMIIPVPLHKSKQRKRTFNQSDQIAKGLADILQIEVRSDLIRRVIATETQTKKSRPDRWKNMENVYSEINELLTGKSVLVVDDVVTTGATIGMLCERLVEANVMNIHIATIARGK